MRKVIDVKRPPGIGVQPYMNEVMSINELSSMDEVEFQLHEHDHSPGVLLKQSGTVSWTPIATRTRSRLGLHNSGDAFKT